MKSGTEHLLAEHYQKTFELTFTIWEQRNRTFLLLLSVVGAASLLTFNVSQAEPLLVDLIAKAVGIDDNTRRSELRVSFPYGLIQSILLMVVMYLMLILYHRTTAILRNYSYLAGVEAELRETLELPNSSVSFTRESAFYTTNRPHLSKAISATYIFMLGLLLISFLGARVYADLKTHQFALGTVDLILALSILVYFRAYALASSSLPLIRIILFGKKQRV